MKTDNKIYDLVILGAGPAGLTASIYASRYKLDHVIIGKSIGGLATDAHKICNYPSEKDISGFELMEKIKDCALHAGGEIVMDEIIDIENENGSFTIKTKLEKTFFTKTLLIASGTERRRLDIDNESQFFGRGISYCATCDGPLFKNKTVAVIGGSNSAIIAALHLASFAQKVYLIYRKDQLRGEPVWIEEAKNNSNIEIIYNTNVVGVDGDTKLQKITLDNEHNNCSTLDVDGMFIEIGSVPKTVIYDKLGIKLDEKKYIIISPDQATSIEKIWAAGDVTTGSNNFRQIITACSEGAIAAESIFKYLQLKG